MRMAQLHAVCKKLSYCIMVQDVGQAQDRRKHKKGSTARWRQQKWPTTGTETLGKGEMMLVRLRKDWVHQESLSPAPLPIAVRRSNLRGKQTYFSLYFQVTALHWGKRAELKVGIWRQGYQTEMGEMPVSGFLSGSPQSVLYISPTTFRETEPLSGLGSPPLIIGEDIPSQTWPRVNVIWEIPSSDSELCWDGSCS